MHFMTTHSDTRTQAPYWSLAGLAQGARMCGAMVPGTVVFAAAYGTLAAQLTSIDVSVLREAP